MTLTTEEKRSVIKSLSSYPADIPSQSWFRDDAGQLQCDGLRLFRDPWETTYEIARAYG